MKTQLGLFGNDRNINDNKPIRPKRGLYCQVWLTSSDDNDWVDFCQRNQHRKMCGLKNPCPHWDGREKSVYQKECEGKIKPGDKRPR